LHGSLQRFNNRLCIDNKILGKSRNVWQIVSISFSYALKAYAKVCGSKSKLEISEANSVYSLQPSVLLVFLLVSGEQTFMANFAITAPKSSSASTAGGRPAFPLRLARWILCRVVAAGCDRHCYPDPA
jgi:hypothetical protein